MKTWIACSAFALLAPLAPEKLAFGPKESTKLEKRFDFSMQLEKRSMTFSVDGRELPEELTKDTVLDIEAERVVVVVDEYRSIDGARPLLLARTFGELESVNRQAMQMPGMSEPQEKNESKKSALLGQTVLFRWDDEKDVYVPEWEGEGANDELLAGLKEDMDLRGLLPDRPVSEGDTWDFDIEAFGKLLGPGGNLGFEDDDDDDQDFEENLKGEARCTYKGVKEVDGRKLARIAAECKGSTFVDSEKDGQKMHMALELEFEGEFFWDLEAKHLASFEISADVTAKAELTRAIEAPDGEHALLIKMDLGGKLEAEGKFEVK